MLLRGQVCRLTPTLTLTAYHLTLYSVITMFYLGYVLAIEDLMDDNFDLIYR